MPIAHGATITVGAEAANARNLAIQLTDAMRRPLAGRATVRAFITSDAEGLVPVGFTADDTVPSVGAAGKVLTDDDAVVELLSNASGQINLVLTNDDDEAKTRYVTLEVGNRHLLEPVAVAFTDNTP